MTKTTFEFPDGDPDKNGKTTLDMPELGQATINFNIDSPNEESVLTTESVLKVVENSIEGALNKYAADRDRNSSNSENLIKILGVSDSRINSGNLNAVFGRAVFGYFSTRGSLTNSAQSAGIEIDKSKIALSESINDVVRDLLPRVNGDLANRILDKVVRDISAEVHLVALQNSKVNILSDTGIIKMEFNLDDRDLSGTVGVTNKNGILEELSLPKGGHLVRDQIAGILHGGLVDGLLDSRGLNAYSPVIEQLANVPGSEKKIKLDQRSQLGKLESDARSYSNLEVEVDTGSSFENPILLGKEAGVVLSKTNQKRGLNQLEIRKDGDRVTVSVSSKDVVFEVELEDFYANKLDEQQIVGLFADEDMSNVSRALSKDNGLIRHLLEFGKLKRLESNSKLKIKNASWLGEELAEDAVLSNLQFTKGSRVELFGSVVATNVTFAKGTHIHLGCQDSEFLNCTFSGVMSGEVSGSFAGVKVHGDAVNLDWREVRTDGYDPKNLLSSFSGMNFETDLAPAFINKYLPKIFLNEKQIAKRLKAVNAKNSFNDFKEDIVKRTPDGSIESAVESKTLNGSKVEVLRVSRGNDDMKLNLYKTTLSEEELLKINRGKFTSSLEDYFSSKKRRNAKNGISVILINLYNSTTDETEVFAHVDHVAARAHVLDFTRNKESKTLRQVRPAKVTEEDDVDATKNSS